MHDFRFSESEIFVRAAADGAMGLMQLAKFARRRTHQPAFLATAKAASRAKSIKLICPSRLGKNSAFWAVDVRFGL